MPRLWRNVPVNRPNPAWLELLLANIPNAGGDFRRVVTHIVAPRFAELGMADRARELLRADPPIHPFERIDAAVVELLLDADPKPLAEHIRDRKNGAARIRGVLESLARFRPDAPREIVEALFEEVRATGPSKEPRELSENSRRFVAIGAANPLRARCIELLANSDETVSNAAYAIIALANAGHAGNELLDAQTLEVSKVYLEDLRFWNETPPIAGPNAWNTLDAALRLSGAGIAELLDRRLSASTFVNSIASAMATEWHAHHGDAGQARSRALDGIRSSVELNDDDDRRNALVRWIDALSTTGKSPVAMEALRGLVASTSRPEHGPYFRAAISTAILRAAPSITDSTADIASIISAILEQTERTLSEVPGDVTFLLDVLILALKLAEASGIDGSSLAGRARVLSSGVFEPERYWTAYYRGRCLLSCAWVDARHDRAASGSDEVVRILTDESSPRVKGLDLLDLCDAAVESSGAYPVPLAQKILLTVLRVLPRMEHSMSLRKSLAMLADHSP